MPKQKVVYGNPHFEVLKTKDESGKWWFIGAPDGVAVLPFWIEYGVPMVLVRFEPIPQWGGPSLTAVMGTMEEGDASPLARLVDELKEEAGYDLASDGPPEDRVLCLGTFYESKRTVRRVTYYLADLTGLEGEAAPGDGTGREKRSWCAAVPLSRVLGQELDTALAFLTSSLSMMLRDGQGPGKEAILVMARKAGLHQAYIRKLPSGKWRVYSEAGKNLGTFPSKEKAEKHLKEIEFFKHKKE
jgi:8-oxo-dGTP pyrophosphatase MutT (NUDIX family)